MKRKLDTRFPAARIKKIMQADEDIGKIAMAVPLLVSKALELFLQDLCDRTYEITTMKGAKTINSSHLKQCVQGFNVFDFLREIVGKVPDLGGLDAAAEDCHVPKKRKVADDDESKKSRMFEDDPDISYFEEKHDLSLERHVPDDVVESDESKKHNHAGKNIKTPVRNIDLNADLDENGDLITSIAAASPRTDDMPENSENREEYPCWSLCEIEKMAIDPIKLADSNGGIDDEDYDEEVSARLLL
ncbi:hypothetical protein GOBAR_AA25775 [Gossypium barbadense]|uniref:Transcription factor CBF/NF-Y/archaeal histone domain-containing protein n=1 Tax=Gossypium barbadense TaxID=3634 RepID=A0A2P5WV05_GOSBA|nr:hypothetical protein GOBAR_AA25775 [Gossypium barbadense]